MNYNTLISAQTLAQHGSDKNWVIFDARFSLANTEAGAKAYRFGHIANARYVHLDKDLSSTITAFTGRHPLPDFMLLARKLGEWGVTNQSQIVIYDDAGGAFAGRLWWLLRCLGHEQAAVLDGGLTAWVRQGLPLTTQLPTLIPKAFRPYLDNSLWLSARELENAIARRSVTVIDARTPERYRGEQEPLDPVAGHIPSALNRPLQRNLDGNGLFLTPALLKQQFQKLLGQHSPEQVVHYCGSGVTACHNLLAMELAGLTGSKLYAGSWSEWIRDKNRTVITQ